MNMKGISLVILFLLKMKLFYTKYYVCYCFLGQKEKTDIIEKSKESAFIYFR